MRLIVEDFSKEVVQEIFSDMMQEFSDYSEDIGFCEKAIIDPELHWFKRASTKTLGRCVFQGEDVRGIEKFYIELNPILLKFEDANIQMIKDVIAHEFCHTLENCFAHGAEFHKKARLIGQLMGYKIDTKADTDASSYFFKIATADNPPYKLVCTKCGNTTPFTRLNKYVKEPYRFQCGKCAGDLVAYKFNKSTGDYDEYGDKELENAYNAVFRKG